MSVDERLRQWRPTADGASSAGALFSGGGMGAGTSSTSSLMPRGSAALSGSGGGASASGTPLGGGAGAGGRCLTDPRAIADRERKTAHMLAVARQERSSL